MKVDEVADFLIREGVRPRFFAINTVVADDAVVLYQEGPARWVVFYTERGGRSSERVYDSEDAACQALIKKALNMEKWMREHESRPHRPHPVTPKPKPVKKDPDFIVGLHGLDHASAVTGPEDPHDDRVRPGCTAVRMGCTLRTILVTASTRGRWDLAWS